MTFSSHDFKEMRPHIKSVIGDVAEATATVDKDTFANLTGYDLVVGYLTDTTLTPGQLDSLLSFVRGSGTYLDLRYAADLINVHDGDDSLDKCDEPSPDLRDLLGGHFLVHPERSTFSIKIVSDHTVTDGIGGFEVFDGPYQVNADDDVIVLACMTHPDLTDYSVVWAREYGSDRVCYTSLDHTAGAFEDEDYR